MMDTPIASSVKKEVVAGTTTVLLLMLEASTDTETEEELKPGNTALTKPGNTIEKLSGNMKRLIKELSENQVNNFTETELSQFIISYGDGQGDTYLHTLNELIFEEEDRIHMSIIDDLYKEYGGNMVNIAWIEDNKLMDVKFI